MKAKQREEERNKLVATGGSKPFLILGNQANAIYRTMNDTLVVQSK